MARCHLASNHMSVGSSDPSVLVLTLWQAISLLFLRYKNKCVFSQSTSRVLTCWRAAYAHAFPAWQMWTRIPESGRCRQGFPSMNIWQRTVYVPADFSAVVTTYIMLIHWRCEYMMLDAEAVTSNCEDLERASLDAFVSVRGCVTKIIVQAVTCN